jgi:PAS domain S-box-containing protein
MTLSNDQIAIFLDNSSEAVIALNKEHRIVYFNTAAEKIFGFRANEMMGQPLDWLLPEQWVEVHRQRVREFMAARETTRMIEKRPGLAARRKDGTKFPVEIGLSKVVMGEEEFYTAIVVDITERKQMEEELRQSEERYRRQTRELSSLNRAGRALTSTLDLSKLLKTIIAEIQNLSRAEAAAVLLYEPATQELRFAAVVGPESDRLENLRIPASAGVAGWVLREQMSELVNQAHADERFYPAVDQITGLSTQSIMAVPLIYHDKAIGVIEAINHANAAFEEHDLVVLEGLAASAAIALENAQLYEAERAQYRRLREMQAQMIHVEKMAAVGRLAASMAHEINNPLQAVHGCLSLGLEELHGKQRHDKLDSYLRMAASEIDRIGQILAHMRDFYRPASEEKRPTDVHAVLRSVLELGNKQLQHNHVTVERAWDPALPSIIANADHLKQVFFNLVLNAVDALAPQGGTLRISTALDRLVQPDQPALDAVRIEFSDTGPGIPPEILPRIFEPFFTAKKGGSGLGLAISYGIIEAHNGQITATSEVGVGTTFTVVLPVTLI